MNYSQNHDWWKQARTVSHDLAPKVRVIGLVKAKQDSPAVLQSKQAFLHRHLMRLGLVASLQHCSWFKLRGHTDYLQAFWETWKDTEGPYRFDQRIGMLLYSALNQPASRARELVRAHVGDVPFLGAGLFHREKYEQEFESGEGFAIVPDEVHNWFFAQKGVESAERVLISGTPESAMSRCREEIANFLDADPELSEPVPDWSDRLKEIHAHDSACGAGVYLSAMLTELTRVNKLALAKANIIEPPDLVPVLLQRCLSGLESDPLNLQEARFRIATTAFGLMKSDQLRPLPDIRDIIRQARPVGPNPSRTRLEEGAKVEFKSSFEWNSRRNEKSGELRLGTLKTIAAFLNSEGGVLYIGIDDRGKPIGIEDDLSHIDDPYPLDIFEGRLREFFKNQLDPVPLHAVRIEYPEMSGKLVCRIEVEPRPGVTYLLRKGPDGRTLEDVYVRDGNRTLNLTGRMRDQFVLSRTYS